MRIGINGTGDLSTLDGVVEGARRTQEAGFPSFWIAQIFGVDALTALAVAGREVPDVELGTAVVPTYPRHPMMLAGQALTTQAATGGRLTLGIGLSHQIVVEGMWGYSFDKPVRHMREYLDVLLPLMRGEPVSHRGEAFTAVGALDVKGVEPPPVLVAALGAQMLKVTGSRGCGTITWCTGIRTLADHIVPTIRDAAAAAGHPPARVVAALPIAVTADVDATKSLVAERFALYGGLPSYRAMLDREGADGPADVAIIGDEDDVRDQLATLAAAGVDEFAAVVSAPSREDRERTRALLAELR